MGRITSSFINTNIKLFKKLTDSLSIAAVIALAFNPLMPLVEFLPARAIEASAAGSAPTIESVTPADGATVNIAANENFTITVDANDEDGDLSYLEFDNNIEPFIPQFTVYADSSNPYGDDKPLFDSVNATVDYNDATSKWTIDSGDLTQVIADNGGITFYLRVVDEADNKSSSFSSVPESATFQYTVTKDEVGRVYRDDGTGSAEEYFDTIQAAIDDNNPTLGTTQSGDKIVAKNGTYPEYVVIDKEITLTSENGRDATAIEGRVTLDAPNSTIDGFSITQSDGIGVDINFSNTTVVNNRIHEVGNLANGDAEGLYINTSNTISGIYIANNIIENISVENGSNTSPEAVFLDSSTIDVSIVDNVIRNIGNYTESLTGSKGAYGVLVDADSSSTSNLVIEGNEFSDIYASSWMSVVGLDTQTPGAEIKNNDFSNIGSTSYPAIGVNINERTGNSANISGMTIEYNNFFFDEDSGSHGGVVAVNYDTTSTPAENLAAAKNYWNTKEGPGGDYGESGSTGAQVGQYVNYSPWLCQPYQDGNGSETSDNGSCDNDPTTTIEVEDLYQNRVGNSFTISGEASDDNSLNRVYLQLVHRGTNTRYGGKTIHLSGTEESWSHTYNATQLGLPEGDYAAHVKVVDDRGNTMTPGWTSDFTLDKTAPVAPSITKPTPRQWFKSTPIKTTWIDVSDPSGIDYYQVAYSYDDGHTFGGSDCPELATLDSKPISGCRDENGTSRNHTPSNTEQGGVTVWVRAVDNVGNASPWSESSHYYYDHTAPVTSLGVSSVVDGVFTVSGDASDNLALNRVYVQLVSRVSGARCGGTTINLIPEGNSANWSQEYDITALGCPEGDYAAHVSVVDRAGNTSSAGWTEDFMVTVPEEGAVNEDNGSENNTGEDENNNLENSNNQNTGGQGGGDGENFTGSQGSGDGQQLALNSQGNTAIPTVLSANTDNNDNEDEDQNQEDETEEEDGNVLQTQDTQDDEDENTDEDESEEDSNFWWWLLLIALLGGGIYFYARNRGSAQA